MPDPAETPHQEPLDGGLTLRTPADRQDIERVAEFNGLIHGPEVAALARHLFYQHPHVQGKDLVFVEDERGQVVSSLCLIPWTWCLEGATLRAGEMGLVGTLEAYHRRGLVRAQVDYFRQRLRERGCLLSPIQGIPYFYRQFGYEYALPLEGGWRLETRQVPDPPEGPFTFRLATPADLPALTRLYDEAAQDLALHAVRDASIWRYLLDDSAETDAMTHQTLIVQNANGEIVGYMRLPEYHFGEELVVDEVSRLGFEAALAALHHLKTLTVERNKPGIRLNLPAGCGLVQLARALGAHDLGTYAWQIHVPDVTALLRVLVPVLERRVADSLFAGLTRDVRLSLYRETLSLRFVAGELTEVANLGFTGDEEMRLPPLQFIPLVLGYRTVEELRAAHPDVSVWGTGRLLLETLFPKLASFIYTVY
jgi:predicted N-acetyltransferase YhbS